MRLLDFFADVIVLESTAGSGAVLCGQLQERGATPWRVDLADAQGGRGALRQALGAPRRPTGLPDVLVLSDRPIRDECFWGTQDGLVEQLECGLAPLAVLVHADGGASWPNGSPSRLLMSDGVPTLAQAVAFERRLLAGLLALLPERASDGPLDPSDWLTIALALTPSVSGSTRRALAWPSLVSEARIAAACAPP